MTSFFSAGLVILRVNKFCCFIGDTQRQDKYEEKLVHVENSAEEDAIDQK